jgi:hypothetical protein
VQAPAARETVRPRVLVLGGYGVFGARLVRRLEAAGAADLIVAGRSLDAARALAGECAPPTGVAVEALSVDAQSDGLADALRERAPNIVVNASGPFQGADYRVARACLAAGCHHIDLADDRRFVAGIAALHTAARDAGLLMVSGASSVPALSSAVADHLAQGLARVDDIEIGISPGQRTERGLSTVRGVLKGCGRPIDHADGAREMAWWGTRLVRYPEPVGGRRLSPCEVPDLDLLPPRYPGQPRVRFGAGLESGLLHRGLNAMALLTRLGLVRDWSRHAPWLWRAARWFDRWGSDVGAMHLRLRGATPDGQPVARGWALVAREGHGLHVPTLAAAALIAQWPGGAFRTPGAGPCVGLLSLAEFQRAAQGLAITMGPWLDGPEGAEAAPGAP